MRVRCDGVDVNGGAWVVGIRDVRRDTAQRGVVVDST